jgi:hypothetical protein
MEQQFGSHVRKETEPIGELNLKYTSVGGGSHKGEITTLDTCL